MYIYCIYFEMFIALCPEVVTVKENTLILSGGEDIFSIFT